MSAENPTPNPDQQLPALQEAALLERQPSTDAIDFLIQESVEAPATDSRQALIDEVLAPYHIHFAEGVEGDMINPEASERNFDILLVTTKLIRDKRASASLPGRQKIYAQDPTMDWFFDKYAASGVARDAFDQPTKVVDSWLKHLGPHNDMGDADEDLLTAREWLFEIISQNSEANTHERRATNRESALLIELDLELAELASDGDKLTYRKEAAALLEAQISQEEAKGNIAAATIAKMKLTSVNIEIAREEILSTSQLTRNYDQAQYDELEEVADEQAEALSAYFHKQLKTVSATIDATEPTEDKELIEKQDSRFIQDVGPLFEVYTYLSAMEGCIKEGTLATERVRPGTRREESGLAHKIDDLPSSKRTIANEAGETVPLPDHGFNYNFDLVVTYLEPHLKEHKGMYRTEYYQNKINYELAPAEEARAASSKFFANKKFFYVQPITFLDGFTLGATKRESLKNMLGAMHI